METKTVTDGNNRKLKKLLIYPKFQIKLLVINLAVNLLTSAIVLWQIKRFSDGLLALGKKAGFDQTHPYFNFVEAQNLQLFSYVLIALVSGILISSCLILYQSHRLAGPILRLRGFFQDMISKKRVPGELIFRKNDFFEELPAIINKALNQNSTKN